MVKVIRALHWAGIEDQLTPAGCKVLRCSRQDAGHDEAWRAMRGAVDTAPARTRCTP